MPMKPVKERRNSAVNGGCRLIVKSWLSHQRNMEMKDKLPDWEDLHRAGVDIRAIVEKKREKQKHNGKVIQLQPELAKHVKQREQHTKQEAVQALPAEQIDGVKLLDEAQAFYRRFIAYPSEHAAIAHTLWTAHTHLMDCWETS